MKRSPKPSRIIDILAKFTQELIFLSDSRKLPQTSGEQIENLKTAMHQAIKTYSRTQKISKGDLAEILTSAQECILDCYIAQYENVTLNKRPILGSFADVRNILILKNLPQELDNEDKGSILTEILTHAEIDLSTQVQEGLRLAYKSEFPKPGFEEIKPAINKSIKKPKPQQTELSFTKLDVRTPETPPRSGLTAALSATFLGRKRIAAVPSQPPKTTP